MIELREMAIKSDKNLALEIKRRSEADKVLQEVSERVEISFGGGG